MIVLGFRAAAWRARAFDSGTVWSLIPLKIMTGLGEIRAMNRSGSRGARSRENAAITRGRLATSVATGRTPRQVPGVTINTAAFTRLSVAARIVPIAPPRLTPPMAMFARAVRLLFEVVDRAVQVADRPAYQLGEHGRIREYLVGLGGAGDACTVVAEIDRDRREPKGGEALPQGRRIFLLRAKPKLPDHTATGGYGPWRSPPARPHGCRRTTIGT